MKKIIKNLFSLLVFLGLGLSFCSASVIWSESGHCGIDTVDNYCIRKMNIDLGCSGSGYLINLTTGTSINYYLRLYNYTNTFTQNNGPIYKSLFAVEVPCNLREFSIIPKGTPDFDYNFKIVDYDTLLNLGIGGSCPECPTCPSQYTSEECQNVYGLVSSGVLNSCQSSLSGCQSDLNSCQLSLSGWDNSLNNCSNNLLSCQSSLSSCIAGNCPLDNGDNVQWSSLFINNIQHIGAPLININIPEEFDWDYSYYTGEFNLDIEGYNTDSDYIAGIITTQNSKPTIDDLNNIVSGVLPLFVPGLVIILFIYFVFRLLKKIF